MTVWIQNPFDNLPCEGYRKQRYWLMAEAFVRAGHSVVLWTSDFSHGAKAPRKLLDPDLAQRCGFTLRLIPTRPYAHNVGLARILSHRAYASTWFRLALSLTSNVQPQTPNLKPQTSNVKPQTSNLKPLNPLVSHQLLKYPPSTNRLNRSHRFRRNESLTP